VDTLPLFPSTFFSFLIPLSTALSPTIVLDFCITPVAPLGAVTAAAVENAEVSTTLVSHSQASFRSSPAAEAFSDAIKFIKRSFISDMWSLEIVAM
jgi:hypothetical protein